MLFLTSIKNQRQQFFKFKSIVSPLTSCQKRYIDYAKNPLPGLMIPRCKRDGTFEPTQCKGLDCFCVDKEGNEIKGTSLPVRLGKPNCDLQGVYVDCILFVF